MIIDQSVGTTVTFESCYNDYSFDIDSLVFYDNQYVTFDLTDDDVFLGTLDLGDFTDPDTLYFTVVGKNNTSLIIDTILNDQFLEVIDLSGFSGFFSTNDDWQNDVDFYIGNLDGGSYIYLDSDPGENELIFGPALTGTYIDIQNFEAGVSGDVLDLGAFVDSFATNVTVADDGGGNTIVTVDGQSGAIRLLGVAAGDLDTGANFDFDGVRG